MASTMKAKNKNTAVSALLIFFSFPLLYAEDNSSDWVDLYRIGIPYNQNLIQPNESGLGYSSRPFSFGKSYIPGIQSNYDWLDSNHSWNIWSEGNSGVPESNKSSDWAPPVPYLNFSNFTQSHPTFSELDSKSNTVVIPLSYLKKLEEAPSSLQSKLDAIIEEKSKLMSAMEESAVIIEKLKGIQVSLVQALRVSRIKEVITAWPTEGWVFYEPFGWVFFANDIFPYFWVSKPNFSEKFGADYDFRTDLSGWCFLDVKTPSVLVYCFSLEKWYQF
jgi:hypothetical protein